MSRAVVSMRVFGVYLILLGAAVIVVPDATLRLIGLLPVHEVWIRVAGLLAVAIGYYYLRAASGNVRAFFGWTVHARLAVPLFFAAFVLLGLARPQLMLLAAGDACGALWTWWALRRDAKDTP